MALRLAVLRAIEAVPPLRRRILASCDYALIPEAGPPSEAASGWDDPRTARRQDRAWSRITEQALTGEPRADVRAVIESLREYCDPQGRVLEVGCGSGYFSRIVGRFQPDMEYVGLDYSKEMVALALERYPNAHFVQGDATSLAYPDNSFDGLIDGAALIHIPNWEKALGEYSRVARGPVILSSLTIADKGPTRMLEKRAYGSRVIEHIFSRADFTRACSAAGLRVEMRTETLDYDLEPYVGIRTTSELWVCSAADEQARGAPTAG